MAQLGTNEEGFLSGGLAGAGSGAAIGAAIGAPAGGIGAAPAAAIGATVGFIAGGIMGYASADKQRMAQKRAQKEAEAARARAIMQEMGKRQQMDQSLLAAAKASKPSGESSVNSTTGFIGSNVGEKPSGSSGTF